MNATMKNAGSAPFSFVTQRIDRIHPRRFGSRMVTEKNADGGSKANGQENRGCAQGGVDHTNVAGIDSPQEHNERRHRNAQQRTHDTANEAQDHCLGQKLARTSRCLAPRARRIPISLVRSVTETSIIFMIPMPPTASEMKAMTPSV